MSLSCSSCNMPDSDGTLFIRADGKVANIICGRCATRALDDVRRQLTETEAERDRADDALSKINDIRNSIVGAQAINWSEHIYPLVAALDEAGQQGMEYPAAREYVGSLIDRAAKAETERDDARALVASLETRLTAATLRGDRLQREMQQKGCECYRASLLSATRSGDGENGGGK